MKLKKLSLFLLSIATLSTANTFGALNPELIIRPNIGVGTSYHSLEYANMGGAGWVLMSAGGGAGLEIGLSANPHKNFEAYSTIGYQQSMAMQYYTSNYGSDKTSYSFGRTSILVGGNVKLRFKKDGKLGVRLGGGGSYNIPTKLSITELNYEYSKVSYNPAFGFHAEAGLFLDLRKWGFGLSFRYRDLDLVMNNAATVGAAENIGTEFSQKFPNNVKNLTAGGVDFSITVRKKIFTKGR